MKRLMHRAQTAKRTLAAGTWALSAVLSTVVLATQIPEPVRGTPGLELTKAGDAELTWWGLNIYKAALWTSDPAFDGQIYNAPVLLSIEYRRDVSRERLLDTTDGQWRRLDRIDADRRRAWLDRLEQIWPDVQEGDVIACLVHPGDHTRFYNRSELLGVVDDPAFGPEFLAIWLDPATEFKAMRAALIGRGKGVML